MAHALEVEPQSFEHEVLGEGIPVLVDFWSPTCPHCLHLNPHFEEAAGTQAGQVKFCKVSAQDSAMPLFHEHHVFGVPTLVLFREGKEVARQSGSRTAQEILAWLQECMKEKV